MYHYIKSDIKGNDRADVWVYYPDMYHSESFKIYKFAKLQKATDLVCATYSEQTFQPTSIEAYLVSKDGERKLNAKMEMSDKSFTVSSGNRSFEEKIGVIPSYNINFDWVDMNSMLPFRLDSEKPFKFGFVTLNSFGQMHYSGLINCEYIGEEIYNGIRCHVYSILSEEYSSKKGRFLTECGTEDLVLIETEHSGNPLYKNFKFELIEKYVIGSKYEWDDFIMEKTKDVLQ